MLSERVLRQIWRLVLSGLDERLVIILPGCRHAKALSSRTPETPLFGAR